MKKSQLSLKWLEVFQLTARTGSVRGAADEAGLSISTVSHHLRSLEDSLDINLFDHSHRPMRVTPTGAIFLQYIDEALRLIRKAEVEAQSGTLSETRSLSIALVEDFDSEIAPELARILSTSMPNCIFRHLMRPSHDTLSLLRSQDVDMGVATRPPFEQPDLIEYPLLRDPFVLAVPTGQTIPPEDYLGGKSDLRFLRYSQSEIMGTQIEAQLSRLRIALPNHFEIESNQTIMSMISEGEGWAITTPTNFLRARHLHRQIDLIPFTGKGFARYLSLFTTDLHAGTVPETIASTMRHLIQQRAVSPMIERLPWLRDLFYLLPDREVTPESQNACE